MMNDLLQIEKPVPDLFLVRVEEQVGLDHGYAQLPGQVSPEGALTCTIPAVQRYGKATPGLNKRPELYQQTFVSGKDLHHHSIYTLPASWHIRPVRLHRQGAVHLP